MIVQFPDIPAEDHSAPTEESRFITVIDAMGRLKKKDFSMKTDKNSAMSAETNFITNRRKK